MKIESILQWIREIAPEETAEPWDRVGLMLGDPRRETDRVLLTLDVTLSVAQEAHRKNCGLIVSHHPLFFRPVERVTPDTPEGASALFCAEHGIAVYSAHTNLDASPEGTWNEAARLLRASSAEPLSGFPCAGLARFAEPLASDLFPPLIREAFGSEVIKTIGTPPELLETFVIATGAGYDALPWALKAGAQALVTGEMKYHEAVSAMGSGLWCLEAGHYETEVPVLTALRGHLQRRADTVQSNMGFFLAEAMKAPETARFWGTEG